MKNIPWILAGMLVLIVGFSLNAQRQDKGKTSHNRETMSVVPGLEFNELTVEEENVIINKGTERPYTGEFYDFTKAGTYICKRCNAPLYRSGDKFEAHCGWPSFDDEIEGAVVRQTDEDGYRTEIVCANCGAHLGHVFEGEQFTKKNTRHCVNSISLGFIPEGEPLPQEIKNKAHTSKNSNKAEAYFAGGCFWGMEYLFEKQEGVKDVVSGYMGGRTKNPTYQDVSYKNTGHAEVIKVVYDPSKVDYETLARLFFEIHDPTQLNRQGPDVGTQYRSEIFYNNQQELAISKKLIGLLKDKGLDVVTKLEPAKEFYKAEDYHQDYYVRKESTPYCHIYTKRF